MPAAQPSRFPAQPCQIHTQPRQPLTLIKPSLIKPSRPQTAPHTRLNQPRQPRQPPSRPARYLMSDRLTTSVPMA